MSANAHIFASLLLLCSLAACSSGGDGTVDARPSDLPTDAAADAEAAADLAEGAGEDAAADADLAPELPEAPLEATGFFHTAYRKGRWWLVTPEGDPFYSTGVNVAKIRPYKDREAGNYPYYEAVAAKYADEAAWAEAQADRLESWGFNTIGAWSQWQLFAELMPYTVILGMSGANWETGEIPDYFAPAFEERCAGIAADQVAPRADDPNLVGWFLDNELRWGPDHRSANTLLDDYLALPEGSAGREAAETWRGDPSGFLSALATRYFEVTTAALRAADPNHLVLGVRSISVLTPPEVPAAAAPFLDVYGVNHYVFTPGLVDTLQTLFGPVVSTEGWLAEYYAITGLPLMITEFSFRAADSGLPNSWPPVYPTLASQAERADAFEDYAESCFAAPYIVGHHWFSYTDEPPGGRFDGEDSNFGLVDNHDEPWPELTERMKEVHARAPGR